MFDLTGRRALVTGASGGIGKAIAQALCQQGAHVALSGTRVDALAETQAAVGKASTVVVPTDLSDMAAVDALPGQAVEALGGAIDILVKNAGLTRDNLAMRLKDDDWSIVMDVNLRAAFHLSKAVLRPMMKGRFGRIINITSIVGVTGNPGQTNYAASKAGLIGMSKSLAQEVASRGITVNCIAPGFIATPMTDALDEAQKARLVTAVPAGHLGDATDVAACAVYLASQEAAYVTGQTMHVNGGMAMI